jgi:hypothetical protein
LAAKAAGAAAIAMAAAPAASSDAMDFSFIPMMALLKALNYFVAVRN